MLVLVLVFVFLFLAAQYESWSVPIAALLSLPIAALGAFIGIAVAGLDNDIYFQIGLVTLIGLAAKNAILIIEFAKVQVDNGESPANAAIRAARLRFRPILMTSLAFILGMLPMVLATGPGSASRHAIGTGVFFGMIFATTFGIVMIPFFFVLVYEAKEQVPPAEAAQGQRARTLQTASRRVERQGLGRSRAAPAHLVEQGQGGHRPDRGEDT